MGYNVDVIKNYLPAIKKGSDLDKAVQALELKDESILIKKATAKSARGCQRGTRSTDKQQLQAKISKLCNKADRCLDRGETLDSIIPILRKIRKLSTI